MSATSLGAQAGDPKGSPASFNILGVLLRYGALIIVDAFALLLIYQLANDGVWELAIFIGIVTFLVNVINIRDDLYPLRWMSPALALMALMIIFPIIYTVYVAFTNFGDGHLLTKAQAIRRIGQEIYLPEDATTYEWTPYLNAANEYGLLLRDDDGNYFFVSGTTNLEPITIESEDALPTEINGFMETGRAGRLQALQALQNVRLGPEDAPIAVARTNAAAYQDRYVYNPELNAFIDDLTGDIYEANDEIGEFINRAAYEAALAENPNTNIVNFRLITGYRVLVGFDNFERFLTSPAIRGPLLSIFIWTITFALISVLSTFVLGLSIALLLQADTPFKKFFRTLLIVPYAIPALIAVAAWRGMLNPNLGVISLAMQDVLGFVPPFFSDPTWARFGILMINLWLGYPYFMLVCSGALAAIPSDMYEAARVDGANAWNQFVSLTLPLLLVSVGPLLIASFTFNFNNFVLIDVYAEGGPPIPGTPTPAGHTDILISYAFRLAFGSGRGADFGLASAITIIIFIMVAVVTLLQFRFTRSWEETSENV